MPLMARGVWKWHAAWNCAARRWRGGVAWRRGVAVWRCGKAGRHAAVPPCRAVLVALSLWRCGKTDSAVQCSAAVPCGLSGTPCARIHDCCHANVQHYTPLAPRRQFPVTPFVGSLLPNAPRMLELPNLAMLAACVCELLRQRLARCLANRLLLFPGSQEIAHSWCRSGCALWPGGVTNRTEAACQPTTTPSAVNCPKPNARTKAGY